MDTRRINLPVFGLYFSTSGQTCGQVRKMGLFNPESREEQAHYVYHENARFREDLRENKRKSEVRLNLRFWSE